MTTSKDEAMPHLLSSLLQATPLCSIKLPKATQLLVINKVPTTDLHASSDNRADALLCSETTGALITAMDTLRLGQTEVDQISPFMRGALESLNKHTWLGRDFEPRARLIEWSVTHF
jgi:hypothetical protein